MITAVHTLIYSDDATDTRAFFKDVLGLPFVTDVSSSEGETPADGDPAGWLIFDTGPSELGVHPTKGEHGGEEFVAQRVGRGHHVARGEGARREAYACDVAYATAREVAFDHLRDRNLDLIKAHRAELEATAETNFPHTAIPVASC